MIKENQNANVKQGHLLEMHFCEQFRELDEKFPLGRESEIVSIRKWDAWRVHAWIIGYGLFVAVTFGSLLVALGWLIGFSSIEATMLCFTVLFLVATVFCLRTYHGHPCVDEPFAGVRITPEDAPEFFAVLNEVSSQFAKSKINQVYITEELNAGARATRKPWRLLSQKREMRIGLSMMNFLSVDEFKAIVAHEMYHLQPSKMKTTFFVLSAATGGWNALYYRFFAPIAKWVRPLELRIRAASHVLCRRAEFLADAEAKRVGGVENVSSGLLRFLTLRSMYVDYYSLDDPIQHVVSEQPPEEVCETMRSLFDRFLNDEDTLRRGLKLAMSAAVSDWEAHPTLVDRMAALGTVIDRDVPVTLKRLKVPSVNATILLGESHERVRLEVDQAWQKLMKNAWKKRFEYCEMILGGMDEDNRLDHKTCDEADAWDGFHAETLRHGKKAGRKWLSRIVDLNPECEQAIASLAALDLLAASKGPGGQHESQKHAISKLQSVIDSDNFSAVDVAFASLLQHYEMTGDAEKIFELEKRVERRDRCNFALHRECRPTVKGDYRVAGLSESRIGQLKRVFEKHKIEKVYVVRKQLKACRGKKYFVFIVVPSSGWSNGNSGSMVGKIVPEIEKICVGENDYQFHILLCSRYAMFGWGRKVFKTDGALIYQR